ncbi:MAG TPA: penicillin-binding protein 2 [Candidatus Baltobacteraceae bacterium]|jgi:penicillin-binding protein 2|nr:penicillin-binding protein 2 [Candidatus Baltobacteraceae bacterium]
MKIYGRREQRWQYPLWRLVFFVFCTVCALAAVIFRLVQVQLVHGQEYRAAAQANQVRLIPVDAPRGLIYDRNGKVVVRSRPSFFVALIPSEVKDIDSELQTIAQTINVPVAKLRDRLLHHHGVNYKNFDEVTVYEPYGPVILANDLPVAKVSRLSEILDDLPGVDVEAQAVRNYPYGGWGSAIFGYVGQITPDEYTRLRSQGYSMNDVVGKDGIEAEYDKYLRGQPGGQRIVVDSQSQVVPSIKLPPKIPVPGNSLVLNIDWRLQEITEQALANGIRSWTGGKRKLSGAVAILDPWTGAVRALASYPDFDPNAFASDDNKKVAYYLLDASQPLFNRAIQAATPTGSTFKMITGSAALSVPVVKVNETVYDSGAWNCYGAEFVDIAAGGLGPTQFVHALAASSDGYFYQMGWRLHNDRLRYYADQYGIGHKTGIDLPGEFEGNFPTNAWMLKVAGVPLEPSDVCSLAIGQGALQATPLQMALVESAVVNGGTLYKPQIVAAVRDPQGHVLKTFPPQVTRRVPVTPQSLKAVREGMDQVTEPWGTAYGLAIDGLPYGGKTGTAETAGGAGPNTTWFVAYAPANHTKIAMAVFVDRSGGYGASVAAPIAREIMVKYFNKKP